jgi:very-short-patch-repair endonuclease
MAAAEMKKYPSPGAHGRARALRREMTEAERRLWLMLRMRQVRGMRFRRQVPIGRYIADFACHEARLVVEVDGGQHDAAAMDEAERRRFLEGEGYRVLRFWNNEVLGNPEGVVVTIAAALWEASTPTPALPHRGGGRKARREAPPP